MGKIKEILGNTTKEILHIIYPVRCPVCGDVVNLTGEKICTKCLPSLKLLTPPRCMKCGCKVDEGEELCRDCKRKSHVYDRNRALYEYGSVAGSIYHMKYGGRREYADFFGDQMAEYLGDFLTAIGPDALIPIPLHKSRKRMRGYNQAELLAGAVGRRLNIPVYSDILQRNRKTVPLKQLNPEERQNNLKKAFNIVPNDVKLRVVVLVDDIYTTGATIDEAAATLRSAGVKKVYSITLACGAGI